MKTCLKTFLVLLLSFQFTGIFSQVVQEDKTLKAFGVDVYSNGRLLSTEEVTNILKEQPNALETYEKGMRLRSNGTVMLVGGIVATIGGIVLMVNGMEGQTNYDSYGSTTTRTPSEKYLLGLFIGTVGEGLIIGGVVCRIVGRAKIGRSIRYYNRTLTEPVTLNFGVQKNGIGFALNF